MIKGFIFYQHGKIPFVINRYIMELFTDDSLLSDFINEYNFKKNYIIYGQCFFLGFQPQKITILVEHSIGSNCYLSCYLIDSITTENGYDTIGIQSPFLDDIFRYKYNYWDSARNGTNLTVSYEDVYKFPFQMDNKQYDLTYRIGHNGDVGLLEDFDKKGEVLITLTSGEVQECYSILIVLQRFAMFMFSRSDVTFKRVTLYNKGLVAGWFYCNLVSDKSASVYDVLFCEFDVMKYVPKILNNIALDSGNKITKSVPLGHLANTDSVFSPQRFIEQIMAFEYLFEKLEPQKAKNKRFPLKDELKSMFDLFPDILSKSGLSSADISEELKDIRVNIVHGYSYYYDFKTNFRIQYMIMMLDRLIQNMSLKWIGFSQNDIDKFIRHFI